MIGYNDLDKMSDDWLKSMFKKVIELEDK